jgi:hypothetical protein
MIRPPSPVLSTGRRVTLRRRSVAVVPRMAADVLAGVAVLDEAHFPGDCDGARALP